MWNDQVDFTEGRRPTTYILRMGRRCEMVRSPSQKNGDQPLTGWGWQMMWNDQVDFTERWRPTTYKLRMCGRQNMVRSTSRMENNHILSGWKDSEMVRLTSLKNGKLLHTLWIWGDGIAKHWVWPSGSIGNDYLLPNVQEPLSKCPVYFLGQARPGLACGFQARPVHH